MDKLVQTERTRLQLLVLLELVCLILISAGCHSPEPFYPLGIYGVPGTNDLGTVRAAGFNAVMGHAEKRYLDAAGRLNLKVMATPGTAAGPAFDADRARRIILEFDRHPALWAWSLVDEPDLNHVPPDDVRAAQRFVKNLGAIKPTALVLYQGGETLHYGAIADITMVDRYPIPWLPLANFPQHVRMARLGVGKNKPLIGVIQTFDWRSYPKLLPTHDHLRAPTYEEVRCMTYCALARQVTGLFYYCFDDGAWRMPDHLESWIALRKVVAEVNEHRALFQAEHLWWPYTHEYPEPALGFNEALESSIIPALLLVKRGDRHITPGRYLLAVNSTDKQIVYRIHFPRPMPDSVQVLDEHRRAVILNDWLEDNFGPFDVHIYGPIRGQQELNSAAR